MSRLEAARARARVRRCLGYHGQGEPHARSTAITTRRTVLLDKSAVTAVFEALGPERVARGLLDAEGHTWEDCFLARAYGAAGELERAMRRDPRTAFAGGRASRRQGVRCRR